MRLSLGVFAIILAVASGIPTKRRAGNDAGNRKIEEFFRPTNVRGEPPPVAVAPESCPFSSCAGVMSKKTSRSKDNPGREFLSCQTCGAFRWVNGASYCDWNGVWTHPDRRHLDYEEGYHMEQERHCEAKNREYRHDENVRFSLEYERLHRTGEWENLSEADKAYIEARKQNINKDPYW